MISLANRKRYNASITCSMYIKRNIGLNATNHRKFS